MRRTRSGDSPSSSPSSFDAPSGSAWGRSILLTAGTISSLPVEREVGIRKGLGLDPLRCIDDEQRALARLQRARHLVGEVDVARSVDQVELVPAPADAHGLGLDRDAALALELHRVEHLLAHLPLRERTGELEDPIRERRLAMVDVRDDREVANAVLLHRCVSARRESPRAGLATVAAPRAREARAPLRHRRRRAHRLRSRPRARRPGRAETRPARHRARTR